jgi:SAM-dependent methyltransferase
MDAADALRESYDETPYHDQAFAEFGVSRMLGLAQLFGLVAPDVDAKGLRVLDLGCASGLHIRDQAARYPNIRFTGIDFSQVEIEDGRKAIAEAGLDNVELISSDLRDVEIEAGAYDLIVCHGIFSWVPDDVKERILLLCRQGLSESGVAGIAYLTYPGWKQREAIRELIAMRSHRDQPPEQRLRESALLLRFLRAGYAACENDPHAQSLKAVVESMQKSPTNPFLHDDLGRVHDPCYFLQFAEWAAECGLQYLAETDLGSMSVEGLDASAASLLSALEPNSLELQQLVDFVLNRSGRSSLLVRSEASPRRAFDSEVLKPLHFGTSWWNVTPLNDPADTPARFESQSGRSLLIESPPIRWITTRLTLSRDEAVAYADLVDESADAGFDEDAIAHSLLGLVTKGVAEPRFVGA